MALFYPLSHSLAQAHRSRTEWPRRWVGVALAFYLMPLILVVLTIGAVGMVVGEGEYNRKLTGRQKV